MLGLFGCFILMTGLAGVDRPPGQPVLLAAHTDAAGLPSPEALDEVLGQLLLVGFSGTTPADAGVRAVRAEAEAGRIGGVVLHKANITSPEQLRRLVAHIHAWSAPWPVLVALAHEGGGLRRLPPAQGFAAYPTAHAAAEEGLASAEATYGRMAAELADLGIDWNLAPVVDLHRPRAASLGAQGRSFAAAPQDVVRLAQVFIEAHHSAGVATALKHFVGQGAANDDPRRSAADTTDVYSQADLAPFAQLIAASLADSIMTAPVVNRHLEPSGLPLTLSRAAVRELLRGRLAFQGVIVTCDLGTGALVRHYTFDDIVVGSLRAGHDMLLFAQDAAADGLQDPRVEPEPDLWPRVRAATAAALRTGRLSWQDLQASAARVVQFRCRLTADAGGRAPAEPGANHRIHRR